MNKKTTISKTKKTSAITVNRYDGSNENFIISIGNLADYFAQEAKDRKCSEIYNACLMLKHSSEKEMSTVK